MLLLLLPVMIVVALLVKLTSPGPVLFRQRRPGRDGSEFSILKFRTMIDGHCAGPCLTQAADPRVTWFGRFIRKWKVDEFPQLFNVILGDMSFVGPRPQPTRLWQQPSIRREAEAVLSVRPGITSQVTLSFRNEEELLAPLSPQEVEEVYMREIMPLKLRMEVAYLQHASFRSDLGVMLRTVLRVLRRREEGDELLIRERFGGVFSEPLPVPEPEREEEYQPAAEPGD